MWKSRKRNFPVIAQHFYRPARRLTLCLLVGLVSIGAGADASGASEEKWYEQIFKSASLEHGSASRVKSSGANASVGDKLGDPAALRSNKMLKRMDAAISRYRKFAKNGAWSTTRKLQFMRQGDEHETVAGLRRQLVITGDIPAKAANNNAGSAYFDEWLERGVKEFQRRHGLRATGRLDRSTRTQLQIAPRARLKQLILNRKRIAQLLHGSKPKRYILVNIPAFRLEAVDGSQVTRRHRVIVGKPDRQTPTLNVKIRGINFLPYWRVPESIAGRDLIPRLKRDPEYLKREHIRVARGSYDGPEIKSKKINWRKVNSSSIKFRQDPGPWNALGLVRINMPNKDIVYLHDTPLQSLFKQHRRAFSAGCVRVQNVMGLASWITKGERAPIEQDDIKKIVDGTNPAALRKKRPSKLDIHLSRPVPVQFVYITAWGQADGKIHFRSDIYGRDGVGSRAKIDQVASSPSANSLSP